MNSDGHVLLQNALHNQPSLAHGVTSRSLDSGFRRNDGGRMLHFRNPVFLGGETYATSSSTHPKLLAAPYTLGRVSARENVGVIRGAAVVLTNSRSRVHPLFLKAQAKASLC